MENDPKSWIVRENAKRENPTSYDDYPNPDASVVTLYVGKGGNKSGALISQKIKKQGKEVLVDDVSKPGSDLAKVGQSMNRLLYATPTLTQDVHISGTPKVTIKLASSKPAANLSVWMVSLPWNDASNAKITDNIITRGWADPQNHKSITESEPLEPGKFYEVTFELMPDDQVIAKGQQIGFMIFSSDKEFTLHPKPGTELTVDLEGTTLQLPIVGGMSAFNAAVE